jgi:hypothetical protein
MNAPFFITDPDDNGRLEVVDTFDTVTEAESVLELLEAALEDDGPKYRLRCAIAELREQLEAHYQAAESTES